MAMANSSILPRSTPDAATSRELLILLGAPHVEVFDIADAAVWDRYRVIRRLDTMLAPGWVRWNTEFVSEFNPGQSSL